jgi:hypothetical protein
MDEEYQLPASTVGRGKMIEETFTASDFEIAIDDARKVLLRANLPCVPKTSTIIEHSIDRAGKELEDG